MNPEYYHESPNEPEKNEVQEEQISSEVEPLEVAKNNSVNRTYGQGNTTSVVRALRELNHEKVLIKSSLEQLAKLVILDIKIEYLKLEYIYF